MTVSWIRKQSGGLFSQRTIGLYAAGLSTRDIRAHLEEVYGLKVSADLVSRVTDAVLEEVSDWQNRALEPMYPIVFLDALRVKIRDAESRQVKNKAVYVAVRHCLSDQWRSNGSPSTPRANARFSACGLPPMKGPNSGFR